MNIRSLATAGLAAALLVVAPAGVALAADDPKDCDARRVVLANAQSEFSNAVALAETRASNLGFDRGVIDDAKARLEDGLTSAEKTGLLVHLPALLAAGGGSDSDLALANRVEAAANALETAQDAVDECGESNEGTPDPLNLDCGDFPLADGRTAQQILDSTPGEDPHGIDADDDRRACEPGQDTVDNTTPVDNDNDDEVVVPSGGVATGGGPA